MEACFHLFDSFHLLLEVDGELKMGCIGPTRGRNRNLPRVCGCTLKRFNQPLMGMDYWQPHLVEGVVLQQVLFCEASQHDACSGGGQHVEMLVSSFFA